MMEINYQKRKNIELFKSLESNNSLFLSKTQNYIPFYKRFFSLNETNYNNINLNHKWFLSSVDNKVEEEQVIYSCRVKNSVTNKVKDREVFFKMAPLLDPYKYLIGKYDINDPNLFSLPTIHSNDTNCNPKFVDVNNAAYVDGFFLFLTNCLNQHHGFNHGVEYYGSFLAIKNKFRLNVYDDIEYLITSEFFIKHKSTLFEIDSYEHLIQNDNPKLKPIKIEYNSSIKSSISINSFDNEVFDSVFEEDNTLNLDDLKNMSIDLVDLTNDDLFEKDNSSVTFKSSSTCSSRSSHTSEGSNSDIKKEIDESNNDIKSDINNDTDNNKKDAKACDEDVDDDDDEDVENDDDDEDDEDVENDDEDDEDDEDDDEDEIIATINQFPVQVICMEYCETTFDELILTDTLTTDEWFSALMQIIMILITYQKSFSFTHNDLHTNNVMFNHTDKKFIYYCYKKKYYKVPTFGRLFKIIDFGRSIYKFNGHLFCSDSFQAGGDASTQYNTEPYLNDKKPRLEPNFSFDLCRLACSIFDYVIEDIDEIKDMNKCEEPIKKIITEWCSDDKGINMLYKSNGNDRYPDFKLYKMIARCVHNHTPQAQLERPEFKKYSEIKMNGIPNDVINIDEIPVYI